MDDEPRRMTAWIQDVKDSCDKDKKYMEERMAELLKEKEARVHEVGGAPDRTTHASTERSEDTDRDATIDPPTGPVVEGSGAATSETVTPLTEDVPGSAAMVETMTTFLQAQAEAMAAHARATAVQQLPALPPYTGEGKQAADDSFERWIERFRERAEIAGWTAEHQLYQLKVHLDHTASDVFRMIPESERDTFDKAVVALRKCFKPKDIEELRGIEFYQLIQENESIEQLGITVQRLGRRAFPSMNDKEFDRLIKGRFFQALLVRWQRKLEAPKPGETFHELYNRAQMMEQYEKQYAASAAAHSGQSSKKSDHTHKAVTPAARQEQQQSNGAGKKQQ